MNEMNIRENTMECRKNPQFKDMCMEWLAAKEIKLKRSSYIKYNNLIERYLIPHLGTIYADDFTCLLFENELHLIMSEENERTLSKSTMSTLLYIIRAVLKFGARRGYNRNIQVEFECSDSSEPNSYMVLSHDDEQVLLKYLLSHSKDSNNLGIILSLMTGMRIGEICALTREAINKDERLINISKTVQRTKSGKHTALTITSPKSKNSNRIIPIPDIIYEYMSQHGVWELKMNDYILSQKETPYEPRTLQYAYKKVLCACKIEYINFHALRHTFATNCVELGFDVKTLSELLGHSSVNFTLNRYVHSSVSLKQRQMKLLDERYKDFSSNS